MPIMQSLYPINPDNYERYFTEEEIKSIAEQISQKPFLFASDMLRLDTDLALPIGGIAQVGFANDPVTNAQSLVFMYQVKEEIYNQLISKEESQSELRIEPYIIGLLDRKENKNYVIATKVTNLMLTL